MHKDQVQQFYEVLWDDHDKGAIPTVLHEKSTFRGSLGQENAGMLDLQNKLIWCT